MSYDPRDSEPANTYCPTCKGRGQYYSASTGAWLPCEHDEPEAETLPGEVSGLLLDIYDMLDDYADVKDHEGNYGITQVPNSAMSYQSIIRETLAKYGVKVPYP